MALRSVSNIVCSDSFTLCLNNDLNVVSFGRSTNGSHGHEEINVFPPKMISTLKHIKSVDCGFKHTVCLDDDGNVFSFGANNYGQLGIGKDKDALDFTYEPQQIDLPLIKQISCGGNFSICLSEDGDLFSFGFCDYGQLGLGNTENSNYPQKISSLKDIDMVECSCDYVICKSISNDVYVWGRNDNGQLGLGMTLNQNLPIKCESWPQNIVDIKCGYAHTLILTSSQEVYSCGNNYNGQLGRKTENNFIFNISSSFKKIEELSEIMRIECGNFHSMCIDNYDNLFVFGHNNYGQLGLGDTDKRKNPTKHPLLSNIIDVSSKGKHTFVKTAKNEIYAFGNNEHSQLGIETKKKHQLTPIRVLEGNENFWCSNFLRRSKAKSARFIKKNEESSSPPKKKQKII